MTHPTPPRDVFFAHEKVSAQSRGYRTYWRVGQTSSPTRRYSYQMYWVIAVWTGSGWDPRWSLGAYVHLDDRPWVVWVKWRRLYVEWRRVIAQIDDHMLDYQQERLERIGERCV